MTIVSQAEYARMREVSEKTVSVWKKQGKLVLADGGVDVEASDAYLAKYRTAGLGKAAGKEGKDKEPDGGKKEVRAGETVAAAADRIMAETGADMSIEEAKRVKENYLALLNQLEYDEKSGAVVAVADVTKAIGEEYARVRTRLLAIPAERAPDIHRMKTVTEVQDALQEMIVQALEELTRDGAGERT
jgi:phage terminase Nu1 subunit (DNA packaging protein)